jgi:hypothetical protein
LPWRLPRNAQIWFPGYINSLFRNAASETPTDVWLMIGDHFEPLYGSAAEDTGRERVALWRREWPKIAERHADSDGRPPRYTFFFPEEEYRPCFLDPLAEMTQAGIGDVEVHLHHDFDTEENFLDRLSRFKDTLCSRHGLMHKIDGNLVFGFIHGNWALDNSLPNGRWCGLNNELILLRRAGCYADFTLPSAPSPAQTRTVNSIYWATDDAQRPKSHDTGIPVRIGDAPRGDLLMIQGPLGVRFASDGRIKPRLEMGELAGQDPPSRDRVRLWLRVAPRLGSHIFIKLFTHGTQLRNSSALLGGDLDLLFDAVRFVCEERKLRFHLVSAWEMFRAIEAIREHRTPSAVGN